MLKHGLDSSLACSASNVSLVRMKWVFVSSRGDILAGRTGRDWGSSDVSRTRTTLAGAPRAARMSGCVRCGTARWCTCPTETTRGARFGAHVPIRVRCRAHARGVRGWWRRPPATACLFCFNAFQCGYHMFSAV